MQVRTPKSHGLITALLSVAILGIGIATYYPGLFGWFVFDDHANLVTTQHWRVTSLAWRDWQRALASDISGSVGRPLAMGSFALSHYFYGPDPFWLKAGNLALHLLNGLLVWAFLHRVCLLLPTERRFNSGAAWIIALAWTIHPLQVSTVMYIVQRMEVGASTGILLSLLAYLAGRSRQIRGGNGWPWLAVAPVPIALGLGFKESASLTPAFALLLELTILRFGALNSRTSYQLKLFWMLLTLAGFAVYLWMVVPAVRYWPSDTRDFGAYERALTQLPVLVMYMRQIVLPVPESMMFFYDNFPISRGILSPIRTAVSGGLILALLAAAFASAKRLPLVSFGIGWFFVGHALTSNLWPLEIAFEHRNYLALLGLLIAIASPVDLLLRNASKQATAVGVASLILALAILCNLQARTWGDPMQLAWTLENRNPTSPRAGYDLGSQLLIAADDDPRSPFWSMALEQFRSGALTVNPSPLSTQGLLLMYGRAGIEPPAEYWDALRRSLTNNELTGERPGVLHALTACQMEGRCVFDTSEMLATFLAVINRNPRNATAHTLYANFSWTILQDRPLAVRLQREAVRLEPQKPEFRLALAGFLLMSSNLEDYNEGLRLLSEVRMDNTHGLFDRELQILEHMARTQP